MNNTINIDGSTIPFVEGQTIMEAATQAGVYIPHLCHHSDYTPPWQLQTVYSKSQWAHLFFLYLPGKGRSGST